MKKKVLKPVEGQQLIVLPAFQQMTAQEVTDFCIGIKAEHERFVESARTAFQSALGCGCRLTSAKVRAGHGNWETYFKEHLQPLLGFDFRTAQRYMAMYEAFERFSSAQPNTASRLLEEDDELVKSFSIHWKSRSETPNPNEWITPPELLRPIERLLGTIDCDPAATKQQVSECPSGQTRYGLAENGLASDCAWEGNVFIAPGHSGSLTPWLYKALSEFESGRMTAGVVLAPANFSPDWPLELAQFPLALSREAPRVQMLHKSKVTPRRLNCRFLLIYLTHRPDWSAFQAAINDTFVVFEAGGRSASVSALVINPTK